MDLHVHSIYSGGSLTPLEILNLADSAFLDAVAISDHNEIRGAVEGQIIAGATPRLPLVLSAQEISAGDHCHFLLIGSTEAQADTGRAKLPLILQAHREQGGIVFLAHPWTALRHNWFRGFCRELVTAGLMDGMELCNASILDLARSAAPVIRGIWEEWLLPYNLAAVGGSDYHYRNKGRVLGMGRTYLKVFEPGENGLLEALRNRRCVAGLFSEIALEFPETGGESRFLLGQEPWLGDLKALLERLQVRIVERERIDPGPARFLRQLLSAGHFQAAADLLG